MAGCSSSTIGCSSSTIWVHHIEFSFCCLLPRHFSNIKRIIILDGWRPYHIKLPLYCLLPRLLLLILNVSLTLMFGCSSSLIWLHFIERFLLSVFQQSNVHNILEHIHSGFFLTTLTLIILNISLHLMLVCTSSSIWLYHIELPFYCPLPRFLLLILNVSVRLTVGCSSSSIGQHCIERFLISVFQYSNVCMHILASCEPF